MDFTPDEITYLKRAYKAIFRENLSLEQAVHKVESMLPECDKLGLMLELIQKSSRGITR